MPILTAPTQTATREDFITRESLVTLVTGMILVGKNYVIDKVYNDVDQYLRGQSIYMTVNELFPIVEEIWNNNLPVTE